MSLTLQVWINTTGEGDSIAKNNNQWNISSISSLYTKDMNRVALEIGIIMELHVMVNFKTFCENVFRVLLNDSL